MEHEILNKLEENYKIQKNRKSKYHLVQEGKYISGIFRGNEKGFGFVKIENEEDEIYISKENSLNALNGDRVLIEIVEESNKVKKAEGKIIKVLKHEKDTVVGIFQNNKTFGFVVPDDKNFGTDIYISKKNFGKARTNHKVLVCVKELTDNVCLAARNLANVKVVLPSEINTFDLISSDNLLIEEEALTMLEEVLK